MVYDSLGTMGREDGGARGIFICQPHEPHEFKYQLKLEELPRGAGAPPVAAPPPTAFRRDSWRTDECKVCLYGLPEDSRPVQSVNCCLGFSVRLIFDQCIALSYWIHNRR